jgi:hypothetical protein
MPLQESELQLITTKLVLFIMIEGNTNCSSDAVLVCGDDSDVKRLRGDNAKFWFIGPASVGMKKGVIGEFYKLDCGLFKEVPSV